MHLSFYLNHNDREALIRHYTESVPASGDAREDARLADVLEALAEALMADNETATAQRSC